MSINKLTVLECDVVGCNSKETTGGAIPDGWYTLTRINGTIVAGEKQKIICPAHLFNPPSSYAYFRSKEEKL